MIEQFDAIVIGAGISGETCAHRLRMGGMRVALVEREYIGGECAYWASIPTATLLGPANVQFRALALAGIASPAIASPRSLTPSEILFSALGEAAQVEAIEKQGGTFIRGEARFIGRGLIAVGERQLAAPHIVIATGSVPAIPRIPGLSDIRYWTNREATTAEAVPQSAIILGGEAQAIEIGQMFRLYGAEVTLITRRDHLLIDEDPEIGELIAQRLSRQGVRVVLRHGVIQFGRDADHACVATLDDTSEIHAQALVVAARRHPRTHDLDLEKAGIRPSASGIVVDETCRAADGVWAVGAVTGTATLSHMAQYQARIAADDILGQPHPAHYESVPRIIYTDPQIAITGRTMARKNGRQPSNIVSTTVDLSERKTHPASARQPESGRLALFADTRRGTLVGAWAAATEASEWIHLAVLAIRSETPLDVLRDMLEQFPPFGEVYLAAVDKLVTAAAQR
ncbi:MAG TPA: NAD(P)/FAD-dependent oxidoreductase [Ktedonobacterales bacterium]|nr:NAD(P)/FAD-dependent oxidoreductase [Ktedonobacterales bacterium]